MKGPLGGQQDRPGIRRIGLASSHFCGFRLFRRKAAAIGTVMRIPAPGQVLLLPMSLMVSAIVAVPAWNHFTIDEESPIYATKAAADHWGRVEMQAQKCLPSTVDFESISENFNSAGPWFGKLRCNQHRIYLRVILVLLVPYLAINFVAGLLVPKDETPKKKI